MQSHHDLDGKCPYIFLRGQASSLSAFHKGRDDKQHAEEQFVGGNRVYMIELYKYLVFFDVLVIIPIDNVLQIFYYFLYVYVNNNLFSCSKDLEKKIERGISREDYKKSIWIRGISVTMLRTSSHPGRSLALPPSCCKRLVSRSRAFSCCQPHYIDAAALFLISQRGKLPVSCY